MLVEHMGATLNMPLVIDYTSVVVGVLTGALFGCRRKADVVGVIVLGFLTGFGGGIVRDLLLGAQDIYFMEHPDLIWLSLAICVFTFYFRGFVIDLDRSVTVADACSVALFAVAGSAKAYAAGLDALYVVMLGTITAVGGGAIRDSFAGVMPAIFARSNYYAVASIAGCVAFTALAFWGVSLGLSGVACFVVVVGLRCLSIHYGWRTRTEADLVPHLERAARRAAHAAKRRVGEAAHNDKHGGGV